MNRRLAIGKLLAGFVAGSSVVSARDFDPRVSERISEVANEVPIGGPEVDKYSEYHRVLESLPFRIRAGYEWLQLANNGSMAQHLKWHEAQRSLSAAILPRRAYRWLSEKSYINRLEACKPDLTPDEWATAKRMFEANKRLFGQKEIFGQQVTAAIDGLLKIAD